MTEPSMSVAALRAEMDLTLEAFGEKVGLSKSQMHEVERTNRASLRVALAIEELSAGRIDAASLSDDVKLARAMVVDPVHAGEPATAAAALANGQSGEMSGVRGEAA